MKLKFYSFKFIATMILLAGFSQLSNAQEMYWRETFTPSGASTNPGTSTAITEYTGDAGVWRFMGVYRTTGTGCPNDGTNWHIRSVNGAISPTFPDTPYALTPLVSAGIQSVSLTRARANRRISFYVTTSDDPATTDWTLANVIVKATGYPNPLCLDSSVAINAPNAVRMKIVFEAAVNNDVDSIALFSSRPLPVTFTSVNAAAVNGFTKVSWNIATEINTRSYIVERSTDGLSFNKVAEVPATNAGSYSWIDNSAAAGVSFYRVKAMDKDGKLSYSGVVKVAANLIKAEFLITPNMISGRTMNLQLTNLAKGTLGLRVTNNMGQVVYSSSLLNEGGSVSKTVQLPTTLNAGTYRVQLVSGSTVLTKTAILQ